MTKLKSKITIEVEYGSPFQKETGDDSLAVMLQAWRLFKESLHKNTKIEITYEV